MEHADDASLGVLSSLARLAPQHRLLLAVTERASGEQLRSIGLTALRNSTVPVLLAGFAPHETLAWIRSAFGDAPCAPRFAEWLHQRTMGAPLYCLQIVRQLMARGQIRYLNGFWVLPEHRPDAQLPDLFDDALMDRFAPLSAEATALVRGIALLRLEPTIGLCQRLVRETSVPAQALLGELVRWDVLQVDQGRYRFSSLAVREAMTRRMDEIDLRHTHRRLGEVLTLVAHEDDDRTLRIEAGWHLMQGGQELAGARLIARVCSDIVATQRMIANLNYMGHALESALLVYRRHRLSVYERVPLLSALAHAAYYEDRSWGERYGEEALDAVEQVTGVALARRLQRFWGPLVALAIAVGWACIRFYSAPRRERTYSFVDAVFHLIGTTSTLTASSIVVLDADHARRIADTLAPFACLPRRASARGAYDFCRALEQIGRERPAEAQVAFETLIRNFQDPRFYRLIEQPARELFLAGCHFARGALASFQADGSAALESAAALDGSGLNFYRMIASELRFLYYENRGQQAEAERHREQVELHAAHTGSAWQVEMWEAAALIPIHVAASDAIALQRVRDRLESASKRAPSLALYARLASGALAVVGGERPEHVEAMIMEVLAERAPRSFVGWALTHGLIARVSNENGNHARALEACNAILPQLTEADEAYATLFTEVELQHILASARLGRSEVALQRIDALRKRLRSSAHPVLLGAVYEVQARVAWEMEDLSACEQAVRASEQQFRASGNPALIARADRLVHRMLGPPELGASMQLALASSSNALLDHVNDASSERTQAARGKRSS
ncbi:MAG: hypothetical protein QM778_17935 [Myxococcales bacterium]